MTFDELFTRVCEALQREQRISYRALRRRFALSDEDLADLQDELISAKQLAMDEDNRVLVWVGAPGTALPPPPATPELAPLPAMVQAQEPLAYTPRHLAEKILTSRSALEGERKQVTVLFCDLQNSTAIATHLGPDNMHALLNRFFDLALEEVHRYEGTINQFLGDGFMALFGAPLAHEDHARRAVLAALALRQTLHAQHADLGVPYGVECQFRMGLNSGLVVVGSIGDNLRMDYSAIGDTTHLAARLQQIAEPDTILLSASTCRLVQGYVRLEALAPVQVRGLAEPITPYKILGTLPRRSPVVSRDERPLSRFVGRERELATLEEIFAQVEAGHGQVVGIVADAGGGKSRLLYEFRQRVAEKRVTYLEGRCLSYGSRIPYHPILDVVRQNCGITERDTATTVLDKVRFALHEVGMDAVATAPYLLHMLGVQEGTDPIAVLTPEALKTCTFETLRQMSLAGSQRRPLLVAVEDLHWMDTTSEAYLALLVESLAGAAIMLLTTYRPPWLDKSYATQLALRSLAPPEALTVVRTTRPDAALPAQLEQTIVEKAEGNPFFLEELARAVLEPGALQSAVSVPDTIQGVLSARIDRLPEDHKRLVQTAAVLGREFSRRLLEAVWDGGAVDPLLVELQRLEFLYERTGAEEPTYVFKHALTQEVAYDSLLTTRRQALHAAAGHALERRYADRLDEVADRLAYHYARTDNTAKAVEYLTRVAERAARSFAHPEALTALEEALVHAERLPIEVRDQRVVELWTRQIASLHWAGRRQEAIALHRERQAGVERLADHALIVRYYVWLSLHYGFLGERDQAVQSAQRALAEAQQCQDEVLMGMAYAQLGNEDFFAGRLLQAVEHSRHAVALLEGTAERYWLGLANYILAISYYFIGEFGQALEAAARVEAVADTIGDRRLQTNAAGIRGWSLATRGDWDAGIAACQDALERAPEPHETALALGLLGHAYLEQGNLAAAIPVLEQAVEEANRYRSRQVQSWFKAYLGEAYRLDQQLDKAQQFASQGYELASSIKHGWGAALAQRTLGRLAHTRGNLAEAEALFQEALDTFASIHARFEAGRTHLDLAALAHTQGNQTGATAHLTQAQALFAALQVPRYVERTTHLARAYGITLHAGAPAAPTEG